MDFDQPPIDPVSSAQKWLKEAESIGLPNPNAMILSLVDPDGRPSARTVLLKAFDARGAVFYTNRLSRKGRALTANPRASALFFWDFLNRQLIIEGGVTLVDDAESDAYFATRPRASQIGAWASRQSEPVESRALLDQAYSDAESRFSGGPVPRPPYWGGYRIALESITFWLGHPFRLHDRIVYHAEPGGGWQVTRLFP